MKKVILIVTCLLSANLAFGQLILTQGATVLHDGVPDGIKPFEASYDFGTVAVGSTKDVTFLITNNYNATDFTWQPSTISGPYSFVTAPTGVINSSGGTTTFTVRYSPMATSGSSGQSRITAYFLQGTNWDITFGGASNTPPVIAATSAAQAVNDNSTLSPFSAATITDADGDNVSATVTLDAAVKGALSGTGLSDDGGGVYSIASTTASDLQTKLRALSFTPTANRSATTETTTFTLAVSDAANTSSDNTTTVISSAVAPVVSSIILSGSPASNATSVGFIVMFSESVSGVDATDFSINTSGTSGSISNVTGSGNTRTVTVNGLSGIGTIRLDLKASGTGINDSGGKAISSGYSSGTTHIVSLITSAVVAASVFLEGAYNGTDLNTILNSSIPLTQPYTTNGHSGGSATTIPANAVDWVLIELREAGSAAVALANTKVGSAPGFLMSDGSIKATDGTSNLTVSLSGNTGAAFYVVIYHRNHLPIMSANAISQSSGTYTIDFTSAAASTYQGTAALTTLSSGKFAMPAGDADGDGDVDATDLTAWRGQNGTSFSYSSTKADFNLDGVINAVDRNDFQQKNNTKASQVPTT